MERPWLYSKTLPIPLHPSSWVILSRLIVVVGYYNVKKGYAVPKLVDMVSTLLTKALQDVADVTNRRFNEIRTEVATHGLPNFYSVEQIDAIATTTPEAVAEVVRLNWDSTPSIKRRCHATSQLIRQLHQRLDDPPTRHSEKSNKVRTGGVRAGAVSERWLKEAFGFVPDRERPPRPCSSGLQLRWLEE